MGAQAVKKVPAVTAADQRKKSRRLIFLGFTFSSLDLYSYIYIDKDHFIQRPARPEFQNYNLLSNIEIGSSC
jgi:hypothetical protein